jgi:aminomethyltransferase
MNTKETALAQVHKDLGARMIEFAGYNMPLEYSGLKDEHLCVRKAVGIFDVSHMGEFWVKGQGATELMQKLTSNDITRLYNGKVQYTCLPNGKGGIVDDILIYRYADEKFMLVVNAANMEKDWDWLKIHNGGSVIMENASDRMSLLAVQGPMAGKTLQKLTGLNLSEMKYYTFQTAPLAGVEEVIISATGYTGAGGFELYCLNHEAEQIWTAVMEAGREFGIKPAGLAARDTLRMEMGYCLYGNDIDETTSPLEAGLGWITKFTDSNRFIDRENLELEKENGSSRKLVGFKLLEKGIPRQHYDILDTEGEVIGKVTSGTMSPSMNIGIGMGYLKTEHASPGERILIRIRKRDIPAEVVSFPIYKNKSSLP